MRENDIEDMTRMETIFKLTPEACFDIYQNPNDI